MISKFDELIEYNSDFIWEVDKNGVYTYVNSVVKEHLGYEPHEVLGKTPFDFMPAQEKTKVEKLFADFIKEKRSFKNVENLNITKDGKEIILETSGVPILDENNDIIGYRGIDRDITEKVKLRNELEKKNQLLEDLIQVQSKMATMGELIGGITQQLRRPLNQINTVASGIRLQKELGIFDEEKLDDLLQQIEHNIELLSLTVNEFRDFFSPNQAELFFNLKKTIKKALLLLRLELKDINIKIKKELTTIEIKGYENLLLQVLVNIIKNSKEALLQNKKIKKKRIFLKDFEDENNLYISIRDNADGIDIEEVQNIFNGNFESKGKMKAGLGLYMSKIIMQKRLKGDLLVENVEFEYKNKSYKGVQFTIVLKKS